MATKENLKPLKILVISMGFVLIGGTVMLASLVWQKATATSAGASVAECPGGYANLKGRGMVMDSSFDGRILRVMFEPEGNKRKIAMLDICTGKVLGTLTIEADSTLNPE